MARFLNFKHFTKRSLISNFVKLLFTVITIIGLGFFIYKLLIHPVQAAWFDDNWAFRQIVAITNSSGSNQTNYQINITLNTTTLISNGKMQSSCNDLRITDSNGNKLPYWIEPGTCNNSSTIIWTKVNSIPTTGNYIYLYYGNPQASSESSAANTFIRDISNVQGAWKMDEASWTGDCATLTVTDSSGNGNSGKACPNASAPNTTTGKFGNAGNFDATNDYVDNGNSTVFDAGATDSFSAEFWVKIASNAITHTVFSKGGAPGWRFRTRTTDNTIFFQVRDATLSPQANSSDATQKVTDGNWHHIVGVRDVASDTVNIYVDGVLHQSTTDTTTGTITNTASLDVGLSTDPIGGQVDEVRYYNKALTQADVTDLFNNYGYTTTNYPNHELVRKRAATEPTAGTPASEEKAPSPIAYWKFDEGYGTTSADSTSNGNTATLAGSTTPTWQTEDLCVSGKCLYFNGTTASVTVSNTVKSVQTVSFWVRPMSTTASMIDLNLANTITATSSAITANGFSSPTIYVNGVVSSTLTANSWQMITVTTATPINASAIKIGNVGAGYTNGFIDDVKLYNYARSANQVKLDYNAAIGRQAVPKGAGSALGGVNPDIVGPSSSALVGYWKMDESSGNAADSSGNGNTLTNTNTVAYAAGNFGNSASFTAASSQYFTTSTAINSVQTIAFWMNPTSTSANTNIVDFDGGTHTITFPSGTITANGFTGTTNIYVNGVSGSTVAAGSWQHVVITTTGSFNTTTMTPGKVGTGYYGGSLDDFRLYSRVLTPAEVQQLYNFAPGPVGYWKLDENSGTAVNDSSGYGKSATITSTSTSGWAPGKYGGAYRFDTTAKIGTNNTYANPNQMTVEAWIYPTGNAITIIQIPRITTFFQLQSSGTQLQFQAAWSTGSMTVTSPANSISLNTWQHVAASYDNSSSANRAVLYINGVSQTLTDTSNNSGSPTISTNNWMIGNWFNQGNPFVGSIDEVKVYNYIRNQKQVIMDMNAGHPSSGSPVGSAAGYWKFDDLYSTTARDSGTQGQNGTLTNMSSPPSVGISGWLMAGKRAGALAFNSAHPDFVDFGQLSYTNSATQLTWSFWVNPNSLATQTCLICKWKNTAAAASRSWAIETGSSNSNAILVEISTDGNTGIASGETGAGQLTVATWTHVEVVYDGTQTGNANILKVYINGMQKSLTFSGTVPTSLQNNSTTSRAGASSDATAARAFNGQLDEMKIYSAALALKDVLVDLNSGQSIQLGVLGTSSANANIASNSASTQYCVPGDTTSCNPPVWELHLEEGQGGTGTTINDTSPSQKATTLTANATSRWIPGKIGKGYSFTGETSGGAKINTTSNFSVPPKSTLEAWIYPRSGGASNIGNIIAIGSSGNPSLRFRTDGTGGNNQMGVVGVCNSGGPSATTGGKSLPFNAWHHVAVTFDSTSSSNAPIVYIDGKQQALFGTTTGCTGFATTAVSWVAGNGTAQAATADSIVDEVRVYDYIRTPAQITQDMNRGAPQTWWKFDECQGATANDSIATVSGTLNGGTPGDCNTSSTAWFDGKTGKNNYSLKFGSAPDLTTVTSTYTYPFSFLANSPASWGGWFLPTSSVNNQGLIDKKNQFHLYTDASGNAICGIFNSGAASYSDASSVTAPVTLNAWNHIICTYDGTNIYTYVNGFLKNTTANANGINLTTTQLYVGQLNDGTDQFTGQADDIKIWNYPLTASQVKLDSNLAGAVRFGPSSGAP